MARFVGAVCRIPKPRCVNHADLSFLRLTVSPSVKTSTDRIDDGVLPFVAPLKQGHTHSQTSQTRVSAPIFKRHRRSTGLVGLTATTLPTYCRAVEVGSAPCCESCSRDVPQRQVPSRAANGYGTLAGDHPSPNAQLATGARKGRCLEVQGQFEEINAAIREAAKRILKFRGIC